MEFENQDGSNAQDASGEGDLEGLKHQEASRSGGPISTNPGLRSQGGTSWGPQHAQRDL